MNLTMVVKADSRSASAKVKEMVHSVMHREDFNHEALLL